MKGNTEEWVLAIPFKRKLTFLTVGTMNMVAFQRYSFLSCCPDLTNYGRNVRKSNISIQKGTFSSTAQSPTRIMGQKTLWNSSWKPLHNSIFILTSLIINDQIRDEKFLKHYQNRYKNHCIDSSYLETASDRKIIVNPLLYPFEA